MVMLTTQVLAGIVLAVGLFYWMLIIFQFYVRPHYTQLTTIPGPRPWPLIGNVPNYYGSFEEKYKDWVKTYGKPSKYFVGLTPRIIVSDPDDCHKVMSEEWKSFQGRYNDYHVMYKRHHGHGLMFNNNMEGWQRNRRIITRAFNVINLRRMTPFMNKYIDTFIQLMDTRIEAKDGELELDITDKLHSLAMDNIAYAAFGLDVEGQQTLFDMECGKPPPDEYSPAYIPKVAKNMLSGTSDKILLTILQSVGFVVGLVYVCKILIFLRPMLHAQKWLRTFVAEWIGEKARKYRAIAEEEAEQEQEIADEGATIKKKPMRLTETNLLQLMATTVDKVTGELLDEDELLKNSSEMLLAGFETVATTMGYCVYMLAKYPDVCDKVREEVERVRLEVHEDDESAGLRKRDHLDYTHFTKLQYTTQVVKEVMRLRPAVIKTVRRNGCDLDFKGHFVPKGINIGVLHHDPDVWEEPMKFDPSRFAPEREAERMKKHPTAFIPFGFGPRICVGYRFAMLEMVLVLARIMPVYNDHLRVSEGITCAPIDGIRVKITKRE